MPYSGLSDFIRALENNDELVRIKTFADPVLEIAEITDRVTKNNGKALLFENNGTDFPLLINAYASDKRMALALGRNHLSEPADDIARLLDMITLPSSGLAARLSGLPGIIRMSGLFPSRKRSGGLCQQVIHRDPDLGTFPILKCWPHDGGKFITLPMVHTVHPETGSTNLGMYRMQVFDRITTGMHWQRHKTGANHFEAWKRIGKKMPVTVTLGGDPVYAYCATAPLPENINEYILAGFLRKKKVRLVKCITNDLYVPEDADIVIEGYVDPSEPLVNEGPFGDHTGFYSLADLYPVFHVTCITHSKMAVYPATIVGIPPQEDAWLARATERIFLPALKLTLQPEIIDLHLPEAGIAHNLVIIRINKTYPGQGMKVINSLAGAGQMMFSKYIITVSGDVDIRNYRDLVKHVIKHTDPETDISFIRGPLDVLDHSSDTFSFGGKACIDATIKFQEEIKGSERGPVTDTFSTDITGLIESGLITNYNTALFDSGIRILILAVNTVSDPDVAGKISGFLDKEPSAVNRTVILLVDHTVDINDYFMVSWQVLGNTDPFRDHKRIQVNSVLLDATIKFFQRRRFPREWPNVVCSDQETIDIVDKKWESLGIGGFLSSPSLRNMKLLRKGSPAIEL